VVAKLVKNCGMFDEHCPARRSVARNLVGQNFHMPAPKKLLELQLKVWGQRPWSIAFGAGLPFHDLMEASMAFKDRVRKGS
jgi:hypothetical protein